MQAVKQDSGQQNKFIFVTGGVLSGIGKGIVTASVAKLLDLYSNHNKGLQKQATKHDNAI